CPEAIAPLAAQICAGRWELLPQRQDPRRCRDLRRLPGRLRPGTRHPCCSSPPAHNIARRRGASGHAAIGFPPPLPCLPSPTAPPVRLLALPPLPVSHLRRTRRRQRRTIRALFARPAGCLFDLSLWATSAMKKLSTRAWIALAILGGVLGLL